MASINFTKYGINYRVDSARWRASYANEGQINNCDPYASRSKGHRSPECRESIRREAEEDKKREEEEVKE